MNSLRGALTRFRHKLAHFTGWHTGTLYSDPTGDYFVCSTCRSRDYLKLTVGCEDIAKHHRFHYWSRS